MPVIPLQCGDGQDQSDYVPQDQDQDMVAHSSIQCCADIQFAQSYSPMHRIIIRWNMPEPQICQHLQLRHDL